MNRGLHVIKKVKHTTPVLYWVAARMCTIHALIETVYSHQNYHFAILCRMSKHKYETVQALFEDIQALALERQSAMLSEEALFLCQGGEVCGPDTSPAASACAPLAST